MKAICINDGLIVNESKKIIHAGFGLEEGEVYTVGESVVDEHGLYCYYIVELKSYKLAERFMPLDDIKETICESELTGRYAEG